MADELLRSKLVSLFPDDEEFVDGFLNTVSETNGEALNRIARAITATDSTDETPSETVEEETAEEALEEEVLEQEESEEEVVEEEETEEESEEEVVEEEEEVVEAVEGEEEVIDIELGEGFVADLTGSEEFRTAVANQVNELFAGFRAEFEERFRALNDSVEEVQEWNQDKPARTKKRAVVSYRPNSRLVKRNADEDDDEYDENASFADVAESSIDDIFGEQ